MPDSHLPPRQFWPELIYSLPQLHYPETLNVAEQLLLPPFARGLDGSTAILHRGGAIAYASLADRVRSLAAGLIRRSVQPGDRVGLRMPNHPDFIVGWLAVQWIGAIAVSIPPVCRRREIEHIVNHSGATIVLCAADLANEVVAARPQFAQPVEILAGPAAEFAEAGPPPPPHPAHRDAPAVISYAAASDGPARGAVHSPAEILATADTYAASVLALSARDVCIGHPALAWAFGLGALLVFPLRAGGTTVLLDGLTPTLLEAVGASRATVLFCVPTMYRLLLRQPDFDAFDLSSLRCAVSAGEKLPAAVAEEWLARTGVEILDGLGSTELAHIFISSRAGASRPGCFGTPVLGYEARIVDEALRELPDEMPGRLIVRGPTGCRYWRDPAAQRRQVRDGWTLTEDICIRHPDGCFEHVWRADDLIVSGGYKIAPAEVTSVLLEHPMVAGALVLPADDPVRGQVAKALVVPAPEVEWSGLAGTLQQYLKRELAPYKCPREIRLVKTLEKFG